MSFTHFAFALPTWKSRSRSLVISLWRVGVRFVREILAAERPQDVRRPFIGRRDACRTSHPDSAVRPRSAACHRRRRRRCGSLGLEPTYPTRSPASLRWAGQVSRFLDQGRFFRSQGRRSLVGAAFSESSFVTRLDRQTCTPPLPGSLPEEGGRQSVKRSVRKFSKDGRSAWNGPCIQFQESRS